MSRHDPYAEITRTREFRREVRRLFRKRVLSNWRWWAANVAFTILLSVMIANVDYVAVPARNWFLYWIPRRFDRPLFCGVGGALLGLCLQFLIRKPMIRCHRETLNNRGIPVCMECGYDLRGQIEPRCPECGTAFQTERRG